MTSPTEIEFTEAELEKVTAAQTALQELYLLAREPHGDRMAALMLLSVTAELVGRCARMAGIDGASDVEIKGTLESGMAAGSISVGAPEQTHATPSGVA